MALSNQQIKFLDINGWKVEQFDDIVSIVNKETGCNISSTIHDNLAEQFALEKIDELLESVNAPEEPEISEEEILNQAGFRTLCESPLEIEDPNGFLITGECANWTKQTLVQKYRQSLNF